MFDVANECQILKYLIDSENCGSLEINGSGLSAGGVDC